MLTNSRLVFLKLSRTFGGTSPNIFNSLTHQLVPELLHDLTKIKPEKGAIYRGIW